MNPIKKIVSGLLILLVLCIYSSCLDDEINGCIPDNDYTTSIDLNITLPEPTKKITRAADNSYRMDFTDLSNVNVVLYPKDTLNNYPIIRYYDNNNTPGKFPVVNGNNLTITVDYNKSFGEVSEIYLVGNYDQQLDSTKFQHPSQLKSLEIGDVSADNFLPKCVFFDKAKYLKDLLYNEGKRKVSVYTAELSRPIAMVSINLEDHGLNPNIFIRPLRISIHNIPTKCKLGTTNIGDGTNIIKAGGEREEEDNERYSFYTNWGTLSNKNKYVGGKNVNNEYEGGQVFYVYENMQLPYLNNGLEEEKDLTHRPYATYIEIYSEYVKTDINDLNKIEESGTITYKFCLGKDTKTDYSVERNIHYDITLQLAGNAGAEEASWRVGLNTTDAGFDLLSLQLNASAATGTIQVLDGGSRSNITVSFFGGYPKSEDWVFIRTNNEWKPIDNNNAREAIYNGKIEYYVKPLRAENNGLFLDFIDGEPYRECEISMRSYGSLREIVYIKQWIPIDISIEGDLEGPLYMERFENNKITWGYTGNNLSATITSPRPEFNNNFLFGDNADGLSNTFYLRWGAEQSEIANNILEKTGYDKATESTPLFGIDKTAMYYIPNSKELERVMDYVGTINSEIENTHDPIDKNADYWSSSVLETDKLSTLYWDGISKTIKSTNDRNSQKRVRYVYRPSKDLN